MFSFEVKHFLLVADFLTVELKGEVEFLLLLRLRLFQRRRVLQNTRVLPNNYTELSIVFDVNVENFENGDDMLLGPVLFRDL